MFRSTLVRHGGTVFPALLAFITVTAVASANGGYFATEWGWSAIALLLVVGTAVAVRASVSLGPLEWTMLGALAAFTGWMALSTAWSVSSSQPVLETERDVVYVAALAAFFLLASRRSVEWTAGSVLAAIYTVSTYALLTRLAPDLFGSGSPSIFYQLAVPFDYWNALGLFVAMGLLLGAGFAVHGRDTALRVGAAAAIVPLACTLYFTFSRGALLALVAGAVVLFALDPERLRACFVLLTLAPLPVVGVALASRSDALTRQGASIDAAAHDGHRIGAALVLLAALEAGVCLVLPGPARRVVGNRRLGIAAATALVAVVAVGAVAEIVRVGGPAKLAGNAYDAFTSAERPGSTDLNRRLVNLSGSGRVDYWRVAWHEYADHPLLGTGGGSYERFWVHDRPNAFYTRNAHNLYLEVLAELGPVGLALLLVALGTPLVAAVRMQHGPFVAALAAVYVAFLVHAAIDWDWQMTGLTLTALFCGAALVVAARPEDAGWALRSRHRAAALAVLGVVVAFVFVVHVGNTAIATASRAVSSGDAAHAEAPARRATRWAPWSYEGWQLLGEAQLAERNLRAARQSLRKAIAKDDRSWRLWFDLAEASKGVGRRRALDRAGALSPRSSEVAALRKASHFQ